MIKPAMMTAMPTVCCIEATSAGTAKAIRISGVQTLTSRGNTFKQNGIPAKDASRFTVFGKCVDAMVEHYASFEK
jgi:hypothetical protein